MPGERMYPILPCPDIDEAIAFYEALGFKRTYRQVRPNPHAVVARDDMHIHLGGIDGFDPEQSYASVIIVVPDPDALYASFAAGLRAAFGKLPVAGIPRMVRPRKRWGTVYGFSVVDVGGNWLRFSKLGDSEEATEESAPGWRASWTSRPGSRTRTATMPGRWRPSSGRSRGTRMRRRSTGCGRSCTGRSWPCGWIARSSRDRRWPRRGRCRWSRGARGRGRGGRARPGAHPRGLTPPIVAPGIHVGLKSGWSTRSSVTRSAFGASSRAADSPNSFAGDSPANREPALRGIPACAAPVAVRPYGDDALAAAASRRARRARGPGRQRPLAESGRARPADREAVGRRWADRVPAAPGGGGGGGRAARGAARWFAGPARSGGGGADGGRVCGRQVDGRRDMGVRMGPRDGAVAARRDLAPGRGAPARGGRQRSDRLARDPGGAASPCGSPRDAGRSRGDRRASPPGSPVPRLRCSPGWPASRPRRPRRR